MPSSWYVSTLGSDGNAGSQAAPFASIQHAVNVAQSGDYILVAQGVYGYIGADTLGDDARFHSPGNAGTISSAFLHVNPAVVLVLDKALQIYGGFDNAFSTWAPSTYRTYIDGGAANRGVYVLDDNSAAGPAFGAAGLDMEGFTIQDCKATGESGLSGGDSINAYGAGMWINDAARNPASQSGFLLKNMVFRGNYAQGNDTNPSNLSAGAAYGAALELRGVGNATLDNDTFDTNVAQGGQVTFTNNKANGTQGGSAAAAVFLEGSVVRMDSGATLTLLNNRASGANGYAGGGSAKGGAFAMYNSTASLQNVVALNNTATGGDGSAMPSSGGNGYGGAIYAENSTLSLLNADIRGGVATSGVGAPSPTSSYILNYGAGACGGIATLNSSVSLNKVQIIDNSMSGNSGSGALWIARMANSATLSVQINNTVVADNSFTLPRLASSGNPAIFAGGILLQAVDATISHTTVANNVGDGILLVASLNTDGSTRGATAAITSSILANCQGFMVAALVVDGSANAVTLDHVLYAGNDTNDNSNGQYLPAGIFNGLDTTHSVKDAFFTSPAAPNYDYSIQPNSPAVGQGVGGTPTDIEGNPFTAPDLGAYAAPPAPRARSTTALFDPETAIWQIRLSNSGGFFPDGPVFAYGSGGGLSKPVVGDWNGDGTATIGVVEVKSYDFNGKPFLTNAQGSAIPVSVFELKNTNGPGGPDIVVPYGSFNAMPIVGNWDNNPQHIDYIGVVEMQNGVDVWKLRNSFTPGVPDITVAYGALGAIPVVGDWNGDGTAAMGVAENVGGILTWKLRNSFTPGAPDVSVFGYGLASMQPLVGDWNSDGVATVGVYDPRTGLWQLRNENNAGAPDAGRFVFGPALASDPYAEPLVALAGDFGGLS